MVQLVFVRSDGVICIYKKGYNERPCSYKKLENDSVNSSLFRNVTFLTVQNQTADSVRLSFKRVHWYIDK